MMMPAPCFQTGTSDNFWRRPLTLFLNGLLIFFLSAAAMFAPPVSAATRAYLNGDFYATPSQAFCVASGSYNNVLQSYTGYFTDGSTFPKAGDVSYVHAVGSNVSGCSHGDAFGPEFFLPEGASFAVSATNPVYCWLSKLDGSIPPYQLPNNSNGSCSQWSSTGSNGGAWFGYAVLPPGWTLEVQVPVLFSKALMGLAGTPGSLLTVASESAYPPYNVYPSLAVTVYPGLPTLTVSRAGTGTGTVTSSPAGISCGATCSASFTANSSVTLTASPSAGSTFAGWSGGGCSGTATCAVTMSTAQSVTATFSASVPQTLTVSKAGTGAGTVMSSPAGINCGVSCSASFTANSNVTLSASPAAGSTFSGWNGAGCTGTGTCVAAMSAAQSVTATFTSSGTPTLITVIRAGTGTGTVISDPAGIDCGKTCSASFTARGNVVLTATAKAGSTFSGWTGGRGLNRGDCSVGVICTLPPNTTQTITATFVLAGPQTLTVSKTGTGTGTVTSSPVGIDCGATCSANFTASSGVTLTTIPTTGSMFTGWNGAGCSGVGTCTVTMGSAQSVSATLMREIGSLSITLDGLPTSSTVLLGIAGPDGLNTTRNAMTGTGFNLSDVTTGTYTVTPPTVKIHGKTYTAQPQSVVVNSGSTPATINIVYSGKATDLTPILMLLLD